MLLLSSINAVFMNSNNSLFFINMKNGIYIIFILHIELITKVKLEH